MADYTELTRTEMHVAIPPIYPRLAAVSIDQNSTRYMKLSEETNRWDCVKSAESWSDSKSCKDHKSLRTIALIFGSMSFRYFRIYIRIVTLVITVVSILLIASAVIIFSRAKTNSDDLQHIHPKANTVNIQPCIVFISLGSLNTFLSLALLTLSAFSSKFKQGQFIANIFFTITGLVGFSTTLGSCLYLNMDNPLYPDLWQWSCINHKNGYQSDALPFHTVCTIIEVGWQLALFQVCLELLTLLLTLLAYLLHKYDNFVKYGRIGAPF